MTRKLGEIAWDVLERLQEDEWIDPDLEHGAVDTAAASIEAALHDATRRLGITLRARSGPEVSIAEHEHRKKLARRYLELDPADRRGWADEMGVEYRALHRWCGLYFDKPLNERNAMYCKILDHMALHAKYTRQYLLDSVGLGRGATQLDTMVKLGYIIKEQDRYYKDGSCTHPIYNGEPHGTVDD